MYMKRPTLANKNSKKKGATQIDAGNLVNSGDNTDRATTRSTTHTPQLCLHADQKLTKTVEFLLKIVKHSSRPLLHNTTVDCSYNS